MFLVNVYVSLIVRWKNVGVIYKVKHMAFKTINATADFSDIDSISHAIEHCFTNTSEPSTYKIQNTADGITCTISLMQYKTFFFKYGDADPTEHSYTDLDNLIRLIVNLIARTYNPALTEQNHTLTTNEISNILATHFMKYLMDNKDNKDKGGKRKSHSSKKGGKSKRRRSNKRKSRRNKTY